MHKILILLTLVANTTYANVTGSDLQNFNAITSGLDFVTVHSSETLIPGIANFGLFANYAVNTLPRYDENNEVSRSSGTDDSILAADINFGLGLSKRMDFGVSLPFIVSQTENAGGSRGEFDQTGITEIRANLKYRLLGGPSGGIASILSINQNLTENNPYTGADAGPVFNFELAFDTTFYSISAALNIGYRLRNKGEPVSGPIEPLGNQIIASGALSYLFSSIDTKAIFEVFTATPTEDSNTAVGRSVSASEALLGFKYDLDRNTAIHFGASSEISNGTSSPDWRVYSGVNYVTGNYKAKNIKAVRKKKRKKRKKKMKRPAPPPLPPLIDSNTSDLNPPEPPGIGDDVFVLRDINFAFDSDYQVVAGAKRAVKMLATHLKRRGYDKIIVEGHTDSIGDEDYNANLGRRRAETIKRYMVEFESMDANRMQVLTYGEYRPVADNGNYQGRQLNRRVVFRVIYTKRP